MSAIAIYRIELVEALARYLSRMRVKPKDNTCMSYHQSHNEPKFFSRACQNRSDQTAQLLRTMRAFSPNRVSTFGVSCRFFWGDGGPKEKLQATNPFSIAPRYFPWAIKVPVIEKGFRSHVDEMSDPPIFM